MTTIISALCGIVVKVEWTEIVRPDFALGRYIYFRVHATDLRVEVRLPAEFLLLLGGVVEVLDVHAIGGDRIVHDAVLLVGAVLRCRAGSPLGVGL